MTARDPDLTTDRFLNGRLVIRQPRNGYRAGVDPVFLAASVTASPGQSVLELGCGTGVASLCLGVRVHGLSLTGVEIQGEYARLAAANARANAIELDVVSADIRALPQALRGRSFDHVIANPPYFRPARGTASVDAPRDTARRESAPLADWIEVAARRLAPRGRLTVIQRADRLPEIIDACGGRLGGLSVLPLLSRTGRPAERIILSAIKGSKAAFRLCAPVVIHEGRAHIRDGESYTREINAVLRDGAALPGSAD